MAQMSLSDAEYAAKRKQTRRETFLTEMEQVVPWDALLAQVEPVYPKAGKGRRPYPMKTMLGIHLLQNWFGYFDPPMEQALYEESPLRRDEATNVLSVAGEVSTCVGQIPSTRPP